MGFLIRVHNALIRRGQEYEPVKEDSQEYDASLRKDVQARTPANLLVGLCLVNLLMFCFSVLVLSGTILPLGMNITLKQTSAFSPILSRFEIPLVRKRMNATLIPSPDDEIFRGDPSPEVDAAWRRISNERPIAITREEVLAMGKDPKKAVRYPTGFNGLDNGRELYAGRIDVFHQIHCLDALRRESHFDYYYGDKYPNLNATNQLHKAHLSHCVYYLLQNIMCQASVDVYTHVWTDTLVQPFTDFQIEHKCRSFDAILDWQENNSLDLHEFYELRRPSDSEPALEMSAEFKALWKEFDFYNPEAEHHHNGGHVG